MNDVIRTEMKSLLGDREVDRRTFVVSSLGAGFALAVLPVTAQTITTSAEGLVAGEVKVPTKDGTMPAYRAMPATGGNFPVVLVVQEIFGVHEHIKDVCRRIAKGGFFAIAPELYARQGDPAKYTDIPKLMSEIVSKVTDAQVMADLDATVAYAKSTGKADTARLGITGFCWGGRIVQMYAAHNPNVRAAVAWYGPTARAYAAGDKTPLDVAPQIKGAVLGLYGGADGGIPNDTVEKMFARAEGRGQHEVRVQDLSGHAACVQRRLPAELPQGAGRGRVEPDDGVVQAEPLTALRRPDRNDNGRPRPPVAHLRAPASLRARHAPHQVELVVGPHGDQVGHPVRQREERGDRADVPRVLVREAVRLQRREVVVADLAAVERDLEREREHRALPRRDVGLAGS